MIPQKRPKAAKGRSGGPEDEPGVRSPLQPKTVKKAPKSKGKKLGSPQLDNGFGPWSARDTPDARELARIQARSPAPRATKVRTRSPPSMMSSASAKTMTRAMSTPTPVEGMYSPAARRPVQAAAHPERKGYVASPSSRSPPLSVSPNSPTAKQSVHHASTYSYLPRYSSTQSHKPRNASPRRNLSTTATTTAPKGFGAKKASPRKSKKPKSEPVVQVEPTPPSSNGPQIPLLNVAGISNKKPYTPEAAPTAAPEIPQVDLDDLPAVCALGESMSVKSPEIPSDKVEPTASSAEPTVSAEETKTVESVKPTISSESMAGTIIYNLNESTLENESIAVPSTNTKQAINAEMNSPLEAIFGQMNMSVLDNTSLGSLGSLGLGPGSVPNIQKVESIIVQKSPDRMLPERISLDDSIASNTGNQSHRGTHPSSARVAKEETGTPKVQTPRDLANAWKEGLVTPPSPRPATDTVTTTATESDTKFLESSTELGSSWRYMSGNDFSFAGSQTFSHAMSFMNVDSFLCKMGTPLSRGLGSSPRLPSPNRDSKTKGSPESTVASSTATAQKDNKFSGSVLVASPGQEADAKEQAPQSPTSPKNWTDSSPRSFKRSDLAKKSSSPSPKAASPASPAADDMTLLEPAELIKKIRTPKDKREQHGALRALFKLARIPANHKSICDNRGVSIALKILSEDDAHPKCRIAAVGIVGTLIHFAAPGLDVVNLLLKFGAIKTMLDVLISPKVKQSKNHTYRELEACILGTIRRLCFESKAAVTEVAMREGVHTLVDLIAPGSNTMKEALSALQTVSFSEYAGQPQYGFLKAIPHLIQIIANEGIEPHVKEAALGILLNFSVWSCNAKILVDKTDGVTLMIQILGTKHPESDNKDREQAIIRGRVYAAGILANLSTIATLQPIIIEKSGVTALLAVLREPLFHLEAREYALAGLNNMCKAAIGLEHFQSSDGLDTFIGCLSDKNPSKRSLEYMSGLIASCATNADMKWILGQNGAMPFLSDLLEKTDNNGNIQQNTLVGIHTLVLGVEEHKVLAQECGLVPRLTNLLNQGLQNRIVIPLAATLQSLALDHEVLLEMLVAKGLLPTIHELQSRCLQLLDPDYVITPNEDTVPARLLAGKEATEKCEFLTLPKPSFRTKNPDSIAIAVEMLAGILQNISSNDMGIEALMNLDVVFIAYDLLAMKVHVPGIKECGAGILANASAHAPYHKRIAMIEGGLAVVFERLCDMQSAKEEKEDLLYMLTELVSDDVTAPLLVDQGAIQHLVTAFSQRESKMWFRVQIVDILWKLCATCDAAREQARDLPAVLQQFADAFIQPLHVEKKIEQIIEYINTGEPYVIPPTSKPSKERVRVSIRGDGHRHSKFTHRKSTKHAPPQSVVSY